MKASYNNPLTNSEFSSIPVGFFSIPGKCLLALCVTFACSSVNAALIAGVDFEGANQTIFNRTPDIYDASGGISVSTGTSGAVFDGWTLLQFNGTTAGANGNLREDGGATGAGATTPNFPARLEGNRTGSWSITVDSGYFLSLDRIVFDVRGATGGTGRNGQFRTSLDVNDPFVWDHTDTASFLWSNNNLPGRTSGNWQNIEVDLSGPLYQNLTDETISFIWGTSNAIDLDSIQVFGTVAPITAPIPEPSVALLGALSTLLILRRRR